MRRTTRRTQRTRRRSNKAYQKSRTKSKTKTKTRTVTASKNTPIKKCVQLFKKYKLTTNKKLIKWMTKNHTDKATKQSSKLKDDYKIITGCFANRKSILKHVQKSKSKTKSKTKSKKRKVKEIKGGWGIWDRCWKSERDDCRLDAADAASADAASAASDAWCDGSGNPDAPHCCITDETKRELLQLQYNSTMLYKEGRYSDAKLAIQKFINKEGILGRAAQLTDNLNKCIKKISGEE